MSESGALIPITDEQAKAVREALKVLEAVGASLREICGTVPEDVVALLGGNWLKVRRAENLIRTVKKAQERLKRDGIEAEPASLSIGLPILQAAADESREELQDIWARLLAAAADPARAKSFRIAFVEAAKIMDPLDAAVLQALHANGGRLTPEVRGSILVVAHVTDDELVVSLENLEKLGLVTLAAVRTMGLTPFGREFLRAIR